MVHRLVVRALAGAAGMLLGCTVVLDFDGYRVAESVTPDAGSELPFGASVANFDSYRFERGSSVTHAVTAEQGVLANDAADARLRAQTLTTTVGGRLALAADGSFRYTPPGAAGTFWGDDYVEYELLATPAARARVRLTSVPPALSLAEVATSGGSGFGLAGAAAQDVLGSDPQSFASAGDVNGDGLEDFVIGVRGPATADRRDGAGRGAYVLFGKRDGANVDLADLAADGGRGFSILGDDDDQTLDDFGQTVAGAGDVNGDGLDDVIIGSFGFQGTSQGIAYVVFGKADPAAVSSAEVRAGNGGGFAILASTPGYRAIGFDVDGAGDVNGDGLADVIIGVPWFDAEHGGTAGGAQVVFGKVGTEPVLLEDITAGGSAGFAILGDRADEFLGVYVAGVGDINGDGLSDVATGTDGASPGRNVVVLGATGAGAVRVADIEAGSSRGFVIDGSEDGDGAAQIARGGDVNGDGRDDILIGAPNASLSGVAPPVATALDAGDASDAGDAGAAAPSALDPATVPERQGIVYVVFGRTEPQRVALRELESSSPLGFAIGGTRVLQYVGYSISSGDIDGDGLSDVVVSSPPTSTAGRAYVVFGKSDTATVRLPPAEGASSSVLTLVGPTSEAACGVVASGSDANGDGLDDLLVSALLYPTAPQSAGGAYVAFGWDVTGALAGRDRALIRGSGNDVLDMPATPLVVARGGNGTDTLRVGSGTATLDLREPGRYQSIEVIDVRGNGPQLVQLDETALRRIPQNHLGLAFGLTRKLAVLGDAEDRLQFDLQGYAVRSGSVYARAGAYYGLQISPGLTIVSP